MPYWNEVITLFQKNTAPDGTVRWNKSTLEGCFWKNKQNRSRSDGAEFKLTSTVCRIPTPCPAVKIGDILVRGAVSDEIDEYAAGRRSTDLMAKYAGKCFLVGEARDNSAGKPGIKHIYAAG